MAGYAYNEPRLNIDFVARGNKIYQMSLKKNLSKVAKKGIADEDRRQITRTVFRDSLNIIPLKLAKFIKTLNLREGGREDADAPFLEDKGMSICNVTFAFRGLSFRHYAARELQLDIARIAECAALQDQLQGEGHEELCQVLPRVQGQAFPRS